MRTSRALAAAASLWASVAGASGETAALPALERVAVNPAPVPIADFTLTDQHGRVRRFSSFRGDPVLVFFGFTNCPDVCPDTMARLKALHERDGGALKGARVVLISVDGERDTPAALRRFLGPLGEDFIGLTGDPDATAKIAAGFASVFFREPAAKDGSYNVMHSTQVFAVDRRGRLRASFVNAPVESMAKITALLLAEKG